MTKEETISYLKAYLDGDTSIGNVISLRQVLQSAVEYLSVQLPAGLDEAAEKNFETMEVLEHENIFEETHNRIFKAGAEWTAGQGMTKECTVGMATKKIICTITKEALDNLDVFPGNKVIVQIRKA